MQTRKCRADTNADRIRTKNNMSPSPSVGDIMKKKDNKQCLLDTPRTVKVKTLIEKQSVRQ